jgi:uncharacterized membrane protein
VSSIGMPQDCFINTTRYCRAANVPMTNRSAADSGKTVTIFAAAFFFIACTWASYARWANFEYRTFDLAYYVQAIWQLIHGHADVSLMNVPLLGNHVEPIVFLFAPLFALFRHPMLFVVVQNAAVAAMAIIGYDIARRFGLDGKRSALLGIAILLAPAAGFIALHEFHPETLAAPLLLLLVRARLIDNLRWHWVWFVLILACKESMALLLIAYCAVHLVAERKRWPELRTWYLYPMLAAIVWFVICTKAITPAFNAGNIDYLALYDRLGKSPGEILRNAVTHPLNIGSAFCHALVHGNLVWGLLLPFLCLPLLKPRWLLIGAPIFLQHLLSWRSSEWNIYFHYAAPLLPLFWIALVEAVAAFSRPRAISRVVVWFVISACAVAQLFLGPAPAIAATTADWFAHGADRIRKNQFVHKIPADASVLAPLPYLSHLAMREKLYSLHHVLKGLKTLSRESYQPPPPTDFVLIDYLDRATFDPTAGYYHPAMKTVDGRIIPSSDRLLHEFLRRVSWEVDCEDELSLYRQLPSGMSSDASLPGSISHFQIGTHTELINITKTGETLATNQSLTISLQWRFRGERDVFPWMVLKLTNERNKGAIITKGLCRPDARDGIFNDQWLVTSTHGLEPGSYTAEAIFIDNTKQSWLESSGKPGTETTLLARPIPIGNITVAGPSN